MIAKVVTEVLDSKTKDTNVIAAFTHVMVRVLTNLDLALPSEVKKIVSTTKQLALSMSDMKKVIMIESLRDIFSEARLMEVSKRIDVEATPDLIAEAISTMLRHASHSIPEIKLRLEQLKIVQSLIQHYYQKPDGLTNTMRASTSLATLASYANFLADAVKQQLPALSKAANSDMRDACASILTILQAAPSIEPMPLKKYSSLVGVVPCSASDGIYRGVVLYAPMTQHSKMEIVNIIKRADGAEIAQVPGEYVPIVSIAGEIERNITAPMAIAGLANLVADEITTGPETIIPYADKPVLRTIGLDEEALTYLAMANADSVAVGVTDITERPFQLIFATTIAEQWRTRLGAATPSFGYFDNAASMLVYHWGAESQEPSPLAQRSQTIDVSAAYDTLYKGNIMDHLSSDVGKPFSISLEIKDPDAKDGLRTLKLRISPLELLLGEDPTIDTSLSHYATVKDPGVDGEVAMALSLASAFTSTGEEFMRDRARSWMVETLTSLATHPAVTRIAVRALNKAVIDERLDARKLSAQYREVVIRAYFGTLLGILMRFGKLDAELVKELVLAVPVNGVSVKAALALATLPMPVNARA
jgi:hypothetical protein